MKENEIFITNYIETIKQKASFLEKNGFSITEISEFFIKYSRKDCYTIGIYYGRYDDSPDVGVRFEKGLSKPEQYSIGWFRNMKRFEAGERDIFKQSSENNDKLTIILSLLEYLEKNFDDITDINFCRITRKKIHENFERGLWGT